MVEIKDIQKLDLTMGENSPHWAQCAEYMQWRKVIRTHTQAYTVLVVTNAVPPSSVAGSGNLCSLIVLHVGSPLPPSVPAYFAGSLQAVKSSSQFEPVWAPRCRWGQGGGAHAALCNISAWPFLSGGGGWILAGGSVFWRGSCCGSASSETQTTETLVRQWMFESHWILDQIKYIV